MPVAAEVAAAFDAPLDLVLVRKIGAPFQPELAMAAVVDGATPIIVRNEDVIRYADISDQQFDAICKKELAEIDRRRRDTWEIGLERIAIVIDDGIATGATTKAALEAIRRRGPKELILAVPAAPPDTVRELRLMVDALVCLETPEPFDAIGRFYLDFRQLQDKDVEAILKRFPAKKPALNG